jgi:hypothetical protein
MGLLKRFGVFMLFIIILIGVSGCMKDELPQQPTKEENKAKEAEMLAYLKDKYKQEFTRIDYIPAKRGFNDGYNKNILIAKSEDEILVNVREKLVTPGKFYDDFLNSYASKLVEGAIDYGKIEKLQTAKTFITLKADNNNVNEFNNGEFALTDEKISSRICVISISDAADEEVLKELYDVYKQMYLLADNGNTLVAAFSGDKNKAERYVNNYLLYGVQRWENYDDSVKEILRIQQKGLSYEQFKEKLKVLGS